MVQLTLLHHYWKSHSFDYRSLLFKMLSRFVIAFLPRSKHLFFLKKFMATVTFHSDFEAQENKICHHFNFFIFEIYAYNQIYILFSYQEIKLFLINTTGISCALGHLEFTFIHDYFFHELLCKNAPISCNNNISKTPDCSSST